MIKIVLFFKLVICNYDYIKKKKKKLKEIPSIEL